MLVAQRYFKVIDVLAVTLKAKVPGFDDSGMHRTHGDLVDFLATHGEEAGGARLRVGNRNLERFPA